MMPSTRVVRQRFAVIGLLLMWLVVLPEFATASPGVIASFKSGIRTEVPYASVQDLSVGPDGSVFVLAVDRVWRFSAVGARLAVWSPPGVGDRAFSGSALAVDSHGVVYVVDARNNRVQRFSEAGDPLGIWGRNGGDGTAGEGNREFDGPGGIAVAPDGSVYVVDHHGIQQLSPSGSTLRRWPADWAGSVAAGGGYVFSSHNEWRWVSKFDMSGALVARLGAPAPAGNGYFKEPPGDVAADSGGRVWVAQRSPPSLVRIGAAGTVDARCEGPWNNDSAFPNAVAVAPDGTIVTDQGDEILRISDAKGDPRTCDGIPPRFEAIELQGRRRTVRVHLKLSESATVRLLIERQLHGVRDRGRCRGASQSRRTQRGCTYYARKADLRLRVRRGVTDRSLRRFTPVRHLGPGRYRFRLSAVDRQGNRSRALERHVTLRA
jgi:sugar lactone lactonase YvrE